MGAPRLAPGERVVLDLREHGRALVVPFVTVPVVVGVAAFLAEAVPSWSVRGYVRLGVGVLALVVLLWRAVLPWLRWRATRYVVTTGRIVVREGLVGRRGYDVPLDRVVDLAFERSPLDRLFRSGTLVVDAAGDRVVLRALPRVEAVHRTVYDLVAARRPAAYA